MLAQQTTLGTDLKAICGLEKPTLTA